MANFIERSAWLSRKKHGVSQAFPLGDQPFSLSAYENKHILDIKKYQW